MEMRYSTQSSKKICSLIRQDNLEINKIKKKIDNTTKIFKTVRMDSAKTTSKTVVQKTTEATGDLIRNKIADKITPAGILKNERNRRK